MKISKKPFTYYAIALIALGVSGCGISANEMTSQSAQSAAIATTPANAAPSPTAVATARPSPKAAEPKMIAVNIFYPDSHCERLVPEAIEVPESNALETAVAKVLEKAINGDFDLAGYRIDEQKTSGAIAIDLRLSPDSPRQFASMTSCEQFAVFGSLRQTLTSNPQWAVKEVRFTQQGEDIFF